MPYILSLLLLSLSPTGGYSQDRPKVSVIQEDRTVPDYTGGFVNGHLWGTMPHDVKVFFVIAFEEGRITACEKFCKFSPISPELSGNFDYSGLVSEIDRFYAETANVLIPVYAARAWVAKKANGYSPAALQDELARFRRDAIEESQKSPSKPEVRERK